MKRLSLILLAGLLLAWNAFAQSGTQVQSQTNAGASSNTNVSADKSGVKAQNDASVSASQSANAQRSNDRKAGSKAKADGNTNTNASAGSNSASMAAGSTLNAVLTKSVDSRKAQEGDEITAKTTAAMKAEGQTVIPKGAKLIGHVTKADARAKGDSSSALGVVFDRAEFGKGQQVPMHAVVQALAVTRASASAMTDEPVGGGSYSPPPSGGASGGGGLVGGVASNVGSTVGATAGGVGQVAGGATGAAGGTLSGATGNVGAAASSTLGATSQGVIGMPGYALEAAAANATQGSLITSSGKSVRLDSGTQMVLRVVQE